MGKRLAWLSFIWLSMVTLLSGCGPHHSATATSSRPFTPSLPHPLTPPDPWLLTTTSPDDAYRPTYLGNGYLGQVMDAAGLGMTGGGARAAEPAAGPGTGLRPSQGPQPASMAGL